MQKRYQFCHGSCIARLFLLLQHAAHNKTFCSTALSTLQVPVGIYPDGEIKYKCRSLGYTAWWQRKTYFTLLAGYILVIPAIIITFCYVNVARVVWRQGRADVVTNGEGVALRRTVRDARFLGRAKIKTIKVRKRLG